MGIINENELLKSPCQMYLSLKGGHSQGMCRYCGVSKCVNYEGRENKMSHHHDISLNLHHGNMYINPNEYPVYFEESGFEEIPIVIIDKLNKTFLENRIIKDKIKELIQEYKYAIREPKEDDEFDDGYVCAFESIIEDLEKLI